MQVAIGRLGFTPPPAEVFKNATQLHALNGGAGIVWDVPHAGSSQQGLHRLH